MELDFLSVKDFSLKAIDQGYEPIVVELIDRREFVILSAPAKVGKSMFALNMGINISCGSEFLGMTTLKGKVLYLQTEVSSFQLNQRMDKMLSNLVDEDRDLVNENMFICDQNIRVDNEEGLSALRRAIEGHKPSLLILDPFYTLHRKKEDSSDEMAPILTNLKMLAKDFDCGVLLIHHQGKRNESVGQVGHSHRGSSSFGDVPDSSLSLSKKDRTLMLKGEFRNRAPRSPIEYSLDEETFIFKLLSQTVKTPTAKQFIENALKVSNPEQNTSAFLKASLRDHTGLGESSFSKAIQELKAEGKIFSTGANKTVSYELFAEWNSNQLDHDNTCPP